MAAETPRTSSTKISAPGAHGTDAATLRARNWIVPALPAIVAFVALCLRHHNPFVDDAYITYRYAANWGAGLGPVYNPGEYVEGFSCFLWMALLALGARLGITPVLLAPMLNLAIGAAMMLALARLCVALRTAWPRMTALAITLMVALAVGTSFYAASGMDTPLFTLAMLLAILAIGRGRESGRYLGALIPLAVLELSRVEGFLYALAAVAIVAWTEWRPGREKPRRSAVTLAIAVTLVTAAIFIVRHRIYGLWISTTVISKGYATHSLRDALHGGGLASAKRFGWVLRKGMRYEAPLLFMGAWMPPLVLLFMRRHAALVPLLAGSFVLLGMALGIWSGGDWMPHDRFLVMLLPVVLVSLVWAVDAGWRSAGMQALRPVAAAVALAMFAVWGIFFFRPLLVSRHEAVGRAVEFQREVGKTLAGVPGRVTLATNTAGEIAYFAGPGVYVRDLLGLTDRHNALEGDTWYVRFGRADYDYTFSPPLDLFQTNAWVDMEALVKFCDLHPATRDRWRFFVTDDWLRASFLVAGDTTSAAGRMLDVRWGAKHLPVERPSLDATQAFFERWRHTQHIERFAAAPAGAGR